MFIRKSVHDSKVAELQAEIAHLKTGQIPAAVRPKTEEVLRDDEGRVYYRFKSLTEMPWRWAAITQIWVQWSEMNMTPELFDVFMEKITEHFNEGQLTKAATLIENMKQRRSLLPQHEIIWKLVSLMYIRSDEDPAEPSESLMEEKIAYLKSKPKYRDFFLSMCLKESYDFGKKSNRAILTSLKKDQETLKSLLPEMQLTK